MGLMRRVGRAFRRVGRVFRRVGGFAKKALGTITKPLSKLTKPFQKIIGKVLDKLPFGLGKIAKGFLGQFLNNPLGLLAGPILGPLGGLLGKAGNLGQIFNMGNMLQGTAAFANPMGRHNFAQMSAFNAARLMFPIG